MNRIPLMAGWMLLPLASLHAQETTPAADDIAARRQSVVDLESHIAQREQRLTERGHPLGQGAN